MKTRLTLLLVVAAASALWSSCRTPTAPEPSALQYFVSPDTLRASISDVAVFSMHSSDSSWRADKYLWDFGDGSPALTIKRSSTSQHTFSNPGIYNISVTATDSENTVLAKAKATAIIGMPRATISVIKNSDTINTVGATLFKAQLTSPLPVTYLWDFGDDTQANGSDTISHMYETDGSYRMVVSAKYHDYIIGSDTSLVTVSLPTTTSADLCSMFSVTSSFSSGGGSWFEFTLPIRNSGEYSLLAHGLTFLQSYDHQVHSDSNSTILDLFQKEAIGGTLSSNGRYLLNTVSNYFDSTYTSSTVGSGRSVEVKSAGGFKRISFPADSLRLISVSFDSIVFSSRCGSLGIWSASDSQWSCDSGACGRIYGPYIGPRLISSATGEVRIVFHRTR